MVKLGANPAVKADGMALAKKGAIWSPPMIQNMTNPSAHRST